MSAVGVKYISRIDIGEQERFVALARHCAMVGLFDGTQETAWITRYCRHLIQWFGSPASVIFTRDVGHHTCGWWKNPEYEQCWHLSCSFADGFTRQRGDSLARLLFGDNVRMTWMEAPYSEQGKRQEVWHYRLFCDEGWNPIQPKGEVYSRLMPINWQSFSDQLERSS
jgi:hypothetical protein